MLKDLSEEWLLRGRVHTKVSFAVLISLKIFRAETALHANPVLSSSKIQQPWGLRATPKYQ